jgi:hypothetical protein
MDSFGDADDCKASCYSSKDAQDHVSLLVQEGGALTERSSAFGHESQTTLDCKSPANLFSIAREAMP